MEGLTDGAVFARVLALGAGPFELHATDAAGVVAFFREVPLPLRDGGVGGVRDLHCGTGPVVFLAYCRDCNGPR